MNNRFRLINAITILMFTLSSSATYYVSNISGQDTSDGINKPWKTLAKASAQTYGPGDSVLLKCGETWTEQLTIKNSAGTATAPIVITSYGTGAQPHIIRNKGIEEQCVRLESPSGISISNLRLGNAGQGIFLWFARDTGKKDIRIEDCTFHDIAGVDYWTFFNEPRNTERFRTTYSNGIAVSGFWDSLFSTVLTNLTIRNCVGTDVKSLFMIGCTRSQGNKGGLERSRLIKNVIAENCTTTGGTFGWWAERVDSGRFENIAVKNTGIIPFASGTTGGGLQSVSHLIIRNCSWSGTIRSGGPDGCGFDFEGDCTDILFVNNTLQQNAGVGLFFYGGEGPNARITVDSCTFIRDNVDPGNISGYEIYFGNSTANLGGTISNNRYSMRPGIQFSNGSSGCTFINNTSFIISSYPTTLKLSPSNTLMILHEKQKFTASVLDIDNTILDTPIIWTTTGGGIIDSTGLFTNNGDTGTFIVRAAFRDSLALFAEATIHIGVEPYISNMAWKSFTIGHGTIPYRDANHGNNTININGRIFSKGVGTAAFPSSSTPADIAIDITGKNYTTFRSYVGQDIECTAAQGTVKFEVLVDNIVKAVSPILRRTDSAYYISVDVTDGSTLTLRVWNGGDGNACDWADWGDAKLVKASSTTSEQVRNTLANFELFSVFPNPLTDMVHINFRTGENSLVHLEIYDISGKIIENYIRQTGKASLQTITLNGSNLAQGAYFLRVSAPGFKKAIRLMKVR